MKKYNYTLVSGDFETSGTMYNDDTYKVLEIILELVKDRNLKNIKIEIKENE